MKLSVIVPAYNERNTILEIINRIKNVPIEKEIIVLDGCSTDGTREILRNIQDPEVKVIFEEKRQGKGAAVRRGISEASGDYLIVQDADLELNPEEYPHLLEPIIKGKAEVVYGSRLLNGKQKMPVHTFLVNKLLTFLINILYGAQLTDIETGFKLLPTLVARKLPLQCNGFDLDPEITIQLLRQGYKICEIPVQYEPRCKIAGKKIHWKDGVAAIAVILSCKFKKICCLEMHESKFKKENV